MRSRHSTSSPAVRPSLTPYPPQHIQRRNQDVQGAISRSPITPTAKPHFPSARCTSRLQPAALPPPILRHQLTPRQTLLRERSARRPVVLLDLLGREAMRVKRHLVQAAVQVVRL